MCPRLNSLTYPRCSISARRNKTARSCTSAAAINECYQSPRSAILHSQRSNPHSDRPATDRTYSSAAPPPYLPRFPPLEVFGSPARTPAYLGSHVVHGPASENLHKLGSYRIASLASASPQKADVHGTPSFSDGCRGAWSLFGSERAGKPEESTDQEHPRPAGRVALSHFRRRNGWPSA